MSFLKSLFIYYISLGDIDDGIVYFGITKASNKLIINSFLGTDKQRIPIIIFSFKFKTKKIE